MSLGTILLIILILILIGALPTWPYSSGWGYYPSGGLGIVLSSFSFSCCWEGSRTPRLRIGEDGQGTHSPYAQGRRCGSQQQSSAR
jgi:hypothetical protein